MKSITVLSVCTSLCIFGLYLFQSFHPPPKGFDAIEFYNRTGRVKVPSKMWLDTITITQSQAFTVDISSAGFTKIHSSTVSVDKNTTDPTLVPFADIKTIGTSSLEINLMQANPGIMFYLNPSSVKLHVVVIGE